MKKTVLLLMVIVLSLIPTAPALAQDDSISPGCEPGFVLADLQVMLADVQTFEDFVGVLSEGGFILADCFDDWLMLLVNFAMDEFGGGALPMPVPQPAPDSGASADAAPEPPVAAGSLTARDAEAALRAAFMGDIEFANQYVCPSERIEPDQGQPFPEDLVINEVSCQRLGNEMNCTFSISSDALGGDLEDELSFEIVDELLCTTLE